MLDLFLLFAVAVAIASAPLSGSLKDNSSDLI